MSIFHLMFRVAFSFWRSEPHSQFQRSDPSLYLRFDIQSRIFILAFRASISSRFGIHSHGFSSAFRVIMSFLVWRSKPHFHFGIQSYCSLSGVQSHCSILGVQSHHLSTIWRSESHLQFGVRSHRSHIQAFRAIISLQFGVQNLHFSSIQHSKPPSLSSSAFRATISFQFGV